MLTINGQKFRGVTFAVEWNNGPQRFAFLSGPIETLRKARTARVVDLELDDGTTLPATMLEVNPSGVALVAIDPKRLPNRQT